MSRAFPRQQFRRWVELFPVVGMLVGVAGGTTVAAWLGHQQFLRQGEERIMREAQRLTRIAEGECRRAFESVYDVRVGLPADLSLTNAPTSEELLQLVPESERHLVSYIGLSLWTKRSALSPIYQELVRRGHTNVQVVESDSIRFDKDCICANWAAPVISAALPIGGSEEACDCLATGTDFLRPRDQTERMAEHLLYGTALTGKLDVVLSVHRDEAMGAAPPLHVAVLPQYSGGALPAIGLPERLERLRALLLVGVRCGPVVREALKTSCEDLGVVFRYGRGVYSKLEEAAQPELIGSGYRPSALLRSTNSFNLAGLQGRLEISSTLKWEMLAGRWYPWAIAGTGLVLGSLLSVWMVEQVRQRQARTEEAIELRSAHAALSAVREVREEVTRELHDNALQNLYALGLELNKGRAQIELAPNEAARSLERGLGEVRRISDDLRRFLSPAKEIGDKATGQAALGSIAERFAHSTGMTVRLRLESEVAKRLSPETIVELAQVMCECLANAHRHGKARKVEVVLVGAGPDGWTFRIQDDGSGFDPQAAKPSPGFGLRNLQQRAVLLGAHLFLDSNSGSGTTVELHYPDSTFTPESGLRQ